MLGAGGNVSTHLPAAAGARTTTACVKAVPCSAHSCQLRLSAQHFSALHRERRQQGCHAASQTAWLASR